MKAYAVIPLLLLTAAVSGLGAQELSKEPEKSAARPLNLSARKPLAPVTDAVILPVDTAATAPTQIPPGSTSSDAAQVGPVMPYGAGYENRQQGAAAGGRSGGDAAGGGNGGAGNGGGGNSGGGGKGGAGGGNGGAGRGGSGRGGK